MSNLIEFAQNEPLEFLLFIVALVLLCFAAYNFTVGSKTGRYGAGDLRPMPRKVAAYQLKLDEMKRLIREVASENDVMNFQTALEEFRQTCTAEEYNKKMMRAFSEACAGRGITS